MKSATSSASTPRRWPARRPLLAGASLLAALVLAACTSDGDSPEASGTSEVASPTASAIAEPSRPTPAATTRAPFILQTPTPVPTPEAMAPARLAETNARRTGVPEVDRVIETLFGGDQAALDALIHPQSAICHEEVLGLGDLEVCPEGVEEGTLVEFFPRASCHGYARHEVPYYSPIDPTESALVAVLRLPEVESTYPPWPVGDYLVVFVSKTAYPQGAFAVAIEDGALVRSQDGCNSVGSLLARGGESPDYLLPPFADFE